MAQKRNPVSLRLQTRLKGFEKRFASCWFTDLYFSQVCTNDLFWRLYCVYLLQKGGSWSGEVSESRMPESCISLQFLYRRCYIISAVLDKRKEEYTISNSGVRARRQDTLQSPQTGSIFSNVTNLERINSFGAISARVQMQPKVAHALVARALIAFQTTRDCSGCLQSKIATHREGMHDLSLNLHKNTAAPQYRINNLHNAHNSEHGQALTYYHIQQDSPVLSVIESLCDISREMKTQNGFCQKKSHKAVVLQDLNVDNNKMTTFRTLQTGYWTSLNLIRGVSAVQNVEFCLYSVVLLYRQRLSFFQIKSTIFKKLSCNSSVRGARLVCSGRQGGRSKSAMRAKKHKATLGNTKLSLFSSRLAFASTSVDTAFGQIGIKLWICYK
ncbi:MAG: hypothetical protein EOP45_00095 [Sphingobacteriaceae bacterium]|nr:MAG: hypothetical protein EOP45_00095 [Sphingobacteriaceae bacterium]